MPAQDPKAGTLRRRTPDEPTTKAHSERAMLHDMELARPRRKKAGRLAGSGVLGGCVTAAAAALMAASFCCGRYVRICRTLWVCRCSIVVGRAAVPIMLCRRQPARCT